MSSRLPVALGGIVTFLIAFDAAVARGVSPTWETAPPPGQGVTELLAQQSPYLARAREAQEILKRGNTDAAIALLEELAGDVSDAAPTIQIPVLGTLGNAYLLGGQYDRAISAYDRVANMATLASRPDDSARALANLVRAFLDKARVSEREAELAAREAYQTEADELRSRAALARSEAAERARAALQIDTTPLIRARVEAEALRAGVEDADPARVESLLASLPPSLEQARLYLLLAEIGSPDERARRYRAVIETSDDARILSYALGGLGEIAAEEGRWQEAANLAVEAQFAAQQVFAYESLYQWERLQGRALAAAGNRDDAIALYERSIGNLERIRASLIAAGTEQRLNFDEAVEPYYREAMALLLAAGRERDAIAMSRQLQFAELQNYFGDDCTEIRDEILGGVEVDPGTVALHVLTLPEQTVVLFEEAGGEIDRVTVPVDNDELAAAISKWRFDLEDRSTNRHRVSGKQLYDWFVAPFANRLATTQPEMLVVSADGALRDVPLAALYDAERKRYLVEDLAVVTRLARRGGGSAGPGEALIFGLSEAREDFAPLPQVRAETRVVQELLDGERLLDEAFRIESFRERAASEEYRTLHLATHGEFRGSAENSFLLASNGRLKLSEFEQTLRERESELELLVLTACRTAAGNGRATLGFAGIAARTGAGAVFASLWFVEDVTAATIVSDFYNNWLEEEETQAIALQKAQVDRIRQGFHPGEWAQFVLITR